jgi:hypothetical protein
MFLLYILVVHKHFALVDIDTDIGHHIKALLDLDIVLLDLGIVLLDLDIVLLGHIEVLLHIGIDTCFYLHLHNRDNPDNFAENKHFEFLFVFFSDNQDINVHNEYEHIHILELLYEFYADILF